MWINKESSAQAAPPHVVTTEVIIDAGHGGVDGGTSYGNLLEKDINLQLAQKLYEQLHKRRLPAVLNRTGDYALSDHNQWLRTRSRHRKDLAQRKELSHVISSRILVSLHVNWGGRGATGPIVLYQRNMESFLLAQQLQTKLNRVYGTLYRPKAARQYYLLNQSAVPAVIVETGFMSHPRDRELLTSRKGQSRIVKALENGVLSYLYLHGNGEVNHGEKHKNPLPK
ncbi:hypothetical protein SY83_20425 [Paenibacillus swuensis]|uniref:MurNAc-LAA domain-containing protein n=1 Tax=Paenibacillus swuensis TaxID=1178515 RepID=A0A172TPT7_9BACL|nr:hypothetical protein SY83_20425 [Paenibacillus swuensis]